MLRAYATFVRVRSPWNERRLANEDDGRIEQRTVDTGYVRRAGEDWGKESLKYRRTQC